MVCCDVADYASRSSIVPHLPQPGAVKAPDEVEAVANGSTIIKSMKNNLVANTVSAGSSSAGIIVTDVGT